VKGGLAIVPVQDTPSSAMLFAHIADLPPWLMGLALLNAGGTDAMVEVYAIAPSGALIGGADDVPRRASHSLPDPSGLCFSAN